MLCDYFNLFLLTPSRYVIVLCFPLSLLWVPQANVTATDLMDGVRIGYFAMERTRSFPILTRCAVINCCWFINTFKSRSDFFLEPLLPVSS